MFLRSKLKQPAKLSALLNKVEAILAGKPNAFNVESPEGRFAGEKMSNVDLTTDPTKVTFTYDAIDYEFLLSDISIVDRIRSRKYKFKVKAVSVVL